MKYFLKMQLALHFKKYKCVYTIRRNEKEETPLTVLREATKQEKNQKRIHSSHDWIDIQAVDSDTNQRSQSTAQTYIYDKTSSSLSPHLLNLKDSLIRKISNA